MKRLRSHRRGVAVPSARRRAELARRRGAPAAAKLAAWFDGFFARSDDTRRAARRAVACRRLSAEPLEVRQLLSMSYVDDPSDYQIVGGMAGDWRVDLDQGTIGLLDAGDQVTWQPGTAGETTNLLWGTDAFGTIQAAIDAAGPGDTVRVAPGEYAENLAIPKPLTLAGESRQSVTIYPALTGLSIGAGSSLPAGSSNVILVQSSDVTVRDLTVDGDNPALTSGVERGGADLDARNGIITDHRLGQTFNNLSVHDVAVRNIYLRGIYASTGGTFDIRGNLVDNVQGESASIGIFNWVGSGVIAGNTVTRANDAIAANHSQGTQFVDNVVSQSGSGVHSDNNGDSGGVADVIRGNQVSDGTAGSYGVWVFAARLDAVVENNVVTGVDVGLAAAGQFGGVPRFSANVVDGQGRVGSTGIYATTSLFGWGDSDLSAVFSENAIANVADGLYVEETGGKTAQITLLGNSFSNLAHLAVDNDAATLVDASGNWWGADDPSTVAALIEGNVDFTPLLAVGTDTSADPGFQGDFSALVVTAAGGQFGTLGRVQEGIDLVTSGGTVWVAPGLYREKVQIGKPLALRGSTYEMAKNGMAASNPGMWDTDVYSVLQPPADDPGATVVTIGSPANVVSNVSFEGFVVEALERGATGDRHLVHVYAQNDGTHAGAENIHILNNVLGPNTNLVAQDGTFGRMNLNIDAQDSGPNGLRDSLIAGNKIFGAAGNGNNVFVIGTHYTPDDLSDFAGTVIRDNEIHGAHRSGVEIAGGVANLTLEHNDIYGNGGFSTAEAASLKYGNGIVVIRTTTGGDMHGANAPYVDAITIRDNWIHNNEKNGIYLGPQNRNHVITGNVIENNGALGGGYQAWDGVRLDLNGEYYAGKPWAAQPGNASNLAIAGNSLAGNGALAARVVGTPTNGLVVDASGNWFGSAELDDVRAAVSTFVDYTPWLQWEDLDDDPANGFQADWSYLHVDAASPQVGALGRVQEGIDRVDDGGVLAVHHGTYNERFDVAKSVEVAGVPDLMTGDLPRIDLRGAEGPSGQGIRITASEATLEGFEILGGPATHYGVYIAGGGEELTEIRVANNRIHGMKLADPAVPGGFAYGILGDSVGGAGFGSLSRLDLYGNEVYDVGGAGATGPSTGAAIHLRDVRRANMAVGSGAKLVSNWIHDIANGAAAGLGISAIFAGAGSDPLADVSTGVLVIDNRYERVGRAIRLVGDSTSWVMENAAFFTGVDVLVSSAAQEGDRPYVMLDASAAPYAWTDRMVLPAAEQAELDASPHGFGATHGYFSDAGLSIASSAAGAVVQLTEGTFVGRLTIDKPITLLGAQAGVDARGRSGGESVVQIPGGTTNPNVLIDIAAGVSGVTIDGLTLIGSPTFHYADEAVIRAGGNNDLTVVNTILDGYYGLVFKGGDRLAVAQNAFTVNKAGVTIQGGAAAEVSITNNDFAVGAAPAADDQAVYLTGVTGGLVSGNTATGFAGGALNGSNNQGADADHPLVISGNLFNGNKKGVNLWGNTRFVEISGNTITGSTQVGVNVKGQDITITGNVLEANPVGIEIDTHTLPTERVVLSGNLWGNLAGAIGARVKNGQVTITENIDGATTGVSVSGGTVLLTGSAISNSASAGVAVTGGTATITQSDLLGNATGVLVAGPGKARVIDNPSTITGGQIGIDVDGGTALVQNTALGGNTIGLRIRGGGIVDAGQLAGGTDFTALGTSTGGNDFSAYTDPATASSGAVVNLNGDGGLVGPQGAPPDVTALANLWYSAAPADIETVVYHDADDQLNGFVDYATLGGLTIWLSDDDIDEGESTTLLGSFANDAQPHVVTIVWGDGATDVIPLAPGVFEFSAAHVYFDDDPTTGTAFDVLPISVTVAEAAPGGANLVAGTSVTVRNVGPSVAIDGLPGGNTAPEGALLELSANVTDPGTLDTFSYHWSVVVVGNSQVIADGYGPSFSFTPQDNLAAGPGAATYTVTLTVTDDDLGVGSSVAVIDVYNVAPTIALAGPAEIDEGSIYTLTLGAVTDPGDDTVVQYVVSWGDGTFDVYTSAGGKAHLYDDDAAVTGPIRVALVDEDGAHANAGVLDRTVRNVAPTAMVLDAGPVPEGSAALVVVVGQNDVSAADRAAGYRYGYDFNNDDDFDDPGEIASSAAASATVPAMYLDDDPGRTIRVVIRDKDGGASSYTTMIPVLNVVPVVDAGADRDPVFAGVPFAQPVRLADPGADAPWSVSVDWDGDLVPDETFATSDKDFSIDHVYAPSSLPATYPVTVWVDDGDSGVGSDSFLVTVRDDTFRVVDFAADAAGLAVRFNRPAMLGPLNLYDGPDAANDLPDLTVVGAVLGPQTGSIVWQADSQTLRWVKTGGVLAPDTYTVTLVSSAAAFQDTSGRWLDGDGDYLDGGDFAATLVVALSGDRVVALPDFARGPGQTINVPALGSGLPIVISDAAGVTAVDVWVEFDPALLSIADAAKAPGLPADWALTKNLGASNSGLVKLTLSGTTPLSGSNVPLVVLSADVPADAPYGASHLVRLTHLRVNEDAIAAQADMAIHKVTYLGDVDGDGDYGAFDAAFISRVVVELDSGFDAHDWTDPLIVGDATGDGTLSGLDASYVAQKAALLPRPEIPDLPGIPLAPETTGADPQLIIDDEIQAYVGQEVVIPVRLDIQPAETGVYGASFRVEFDPAVLSIDALTGVLPGADWPAGDWNITANQVEPGRLMVIVSGTEASSVGLREIARLRFAVNTTARGNTLTPLDVNPKLPAEGGLTWTDDDGSLRIAARVVEGGRRVFYNESVFDGESAAADANDDMAIAADKVALMPGQLASFANVTSYARGINGVMIDIAGLPGAPLSTEDFQFRVGLSNDTDWTNAPAPSIATRDLGDGVTRVTLVWPSDDPNTPQREPGSISGQWLQVVVLPTAATGLATGDAFYFGNAIGDTGNSPSNFWVTSADEIAARNHQGFNKPITDPYDFDRDGWVNATDQVIARNHQVIGRGTLQKIVAPLPSGCEPGGVVLGVAGTSPRIAAATSGDSVYPASGDAIAQPDDAAGDDYGWLAELIAQQSDDATKPGAAIRRSAEHDAVDRALAELLG